MSVLAMGELLIDFVALESGVSVGEASGFVKAPGGAPANVAVALARLGHRSGFLTQVGDDPFGHHLEGMLRSAGVDTRGVLFSDRARTALAFVALGADGERSFAFYRNPSADMLLHRDALDFSLIDQFDIFHFGSITLIDEPVRTATLEAARYARAHGKRLSYDPNLRRALWPSDAAARAGMMDGMALAEIVKVSDEELVFLTGTSEANALWGAHMKLLVVTHGAGGATIYTTRERFYAPGFAVQAVDTTGAGDAFVAGLLHGLLTHGEAFDRHLEPIARFANACGALTTTRKGAIPALPTRAQVEAFLAVHDRADDAPRDAPADAPAAPPTLPA
jgi:fructokinase